MTAYTKPRSTHQMLTAAAVDMVTLTVPAADIAAGAGYVISAGTKTYFYSVVEVLNRDPANPVYFTVDGSAPTVAGDGTFVVGAGAALIVAVQPGSSVQLIAASAVAYTVTGIVSQ